MNVENDKKWKKLRNLARNLAQVISKSEAFLSGILCDYRGATKVKKAIEATKEGLSKLDITFNEKGGFIATEKCIRILIPEYFSISQKEIREVYRLDPDKLTANQLAKIILIIEALESQIKIRNENLMTKNINMKEYRSIADEVSWRLNEVKLGLLEYVK